MFLFLCEIFCIFHSVSICYLSAYILTISGSLFYYYALIISRRMVICIAYERVLIHNIFFFKLPLTNLRPYTLSRSSRSFNNTVLSYHCWVQTLQTKWRMICCCKHISAILLNRTSLAQNLGNMATF